MNARYTGRNESGVGYGGVRMEIGTEVKPSRLPAQNGFGGV